MRQVNVMPEPVIFVDKREKYEYYRLFGYKCSDKFPISAGELYVKIMPQIAGLYNTFYKGI